jgi:hypothetical protein
MKWGWGCKSKGERSANAIERPAVNGGPETRRVMNDPQADRAAKCRSSGPLIDLFYVFPDLTVRATSCRPSGPESRPEAQILAMTKG